jgi:hypothetical protein
MALLVSDKTILYRPVGPAELELVRQSGWRRFPPRLPHQPIFYPVLDLEYATEIARDWNAKESGEGHVLRFAVHTSFLVSFVLATAGGKTRREYWIPAESLEEFNDHIDGEIVLVASYRKDA